MTSVVQVGEVAGAGMSGRQDQVMGRRPWRDLTLEEKQERLADIRDRQRDQIVREVRRLRQR